MPSPLDQRIADLIDTATEWDPEAIASTAVASLPPDAVRAELVRLAARHVAVIAHRNRANAYTAPPSPPAPPNASKRWQAAAATWQRTLATWETWLDANGDIHHTRLGDMNATQLRGAAELRDRIAAQNAAAAEARRRLADLLDDTRSATVADLPATAAQQALAA